MIAPKWKTNTQEHRSVVVYTDKHRAKSQLARLDARLGTGVGADKERRQLARLIEVG